MSERLLRLSSFVIKEIIDVLQQPRLVLTLILGPFLILLLFGLGFTGAQRPVETILVVPPAAELPHDLLDQADRFRLFLPIREILESKEAALETLEAGEVDLVAVLPMETYSALLAGRQIKIELLINEIDPMRRDYIGYVGRFLVTELNKEILTQAMNMGKQLAPKLREFSIQTLDELILLGEDLEDRDLDEAQARLDQILEETDSEGDVEEPSSQVLLGVGAVLYTLGAPAEDLERLERAPESLRELRNDLEEMQEELDQERVDIRAQIEKVKTLRDTVAELQATAGLLEQIPVDVLVAPLATEVDNVSDFAPDYLGFYAPAVLALLLQHMAVSFSSLTLVRERLLGAEEVFRVAPIAPWEILTGKYASYTVLILGIAGILTLLIVWLMGVPLLGSLAYYGLTMVLLCIASLGWGFLISLFSKRESQSVQLSMLLLISSVFFSGFFLPIFSLMPAVRVVSYALPVTYGLEALQGIMLAGRDPSAGTLLPLVGLSLGLYALCTLIYSWQHKKE